MPGNIKQPDRFWDWQSAALAIVLVQIAALRLELTDWTPFLSLTQTLGFFGALLGLTLGYSILYPRTVRGFGLAYGLVFIPAQLLLVVERTDRLWFDLDIIIFRLFNSIILLFQSQPVYDKLFFITLVSIGFWCVGLYVGYQLTRNQNFLGVTLPAGIVIMVVHIYDSWSPLRVWLLAVYIFVSLILLGRLYFLQSKNNWKAQHVFFTSDAEGDVSRVALGFAAAVILIAWIFPSALSSVGPAAKAWSEFTRPLRDRLSNAVSALNSPYTIPVSDNFYGEELDLGSSAPLGDTPVFYVAMDRVTIEPARYYWRGRVYDQYLDGQWTNSIKPANRNFNPELDQLKPDNPLGRVSVELSVTLNFPNQELMYAPPEIVWTDHASRLLFTPINDTDFEVSAWMASPRLSAGDTYKVRAQVLNPTIEDLREAGEEYPQWVKDRYLQIPPEIEPQIKELATRVTADKNTPYDKAQAITAFLRKEISYTLRLDDSPPREADPVTWVLFEYKKGFCTYVASSEILMLRSLGIPARMAVGFAQGKYDPVRGRYVVARLNSHAWPEAYFPNIGWVEFEPTGNQDTLSRPRRPVESAFEEETKPKRLPERLPDSDNIEKDDPGISTVQDNDGITFARVMRFTYPLFLLGLFAFAIFIMQRYSIVDRLPVYLEGRYVESGRKPPQWLMRWSKWAQLIPIQRAFHAVDISLRWLGNARPAHTTPLQRANALIELLPSAREDIIALKEEHESALFTQHAGSLERARRASRKILLETVRVRLRRINHQQELR